MKLDESSQVTLMTDGLNAAEYVLYHRGLYADPKLNREAASEVITAYLSAITPAEAGGLVERLRSVVEISEPLEAENCVEAWNWLVKQAHEAATALASERAAHAQTMQERDEALKALADIADMTDADDPESYRSDDREGCLDAVHDAARRVREGGSNG